MNIGTEDGLEGRRRGEERMRIEEMMVGRWMRRGWNRRGR
jgi:hypothetical protein